MNLDGCDDKYMRMALELAVKGIGSVEPNPAVGAVIVKDGKVIGKGFHRKFGGPHAEINAFADCAKKGNDAAGSTMYVSLEPCCHFGKTGPCTEAIIQAGVKKVVAAVMDPMKHCSGKGIERLKAAGIEVEHGLCEKEARAINAPFFKTAITGQCWVILKWAQSIDGKCAYKEQTVENRWISNEHSRKNAHNLRRRAGAILVGIGTVLADDPMLTPRPSGGKNPIRAVLDSNLRIPVECRLVKTAKKTPLVIFTTIQAIESGQEKVGILQKAGAEIISIECDGKSCDTLAVMAELARRKAGQVLVEGGPTLLRSFMRAGLGDEVRIYISPRFLGADGTAEIAGALEQLKSRGLKDVNILNFDGDVCISGLL